MWKQLADSCGGLWACELWLRSQPRIELEWELQTSICRCVVFSGVPSFHSKDMLPRTRAQPSPVFSLVNCTCARRTIPRLLDKLPVFSCRFLIDLGQPQNRKWLSINWRSTSFELYFFQDVNRLLLLPSPSLLSAFLRRHDIMSVLKTPSQTLLNLWSGSGSFRNCFRCLFIMHRVFVVCTFTFLWQRKGGLLWKEAKVVTHRPYFQEFCCPNNTRYQ